MNLNELVSETLGKIEKKSNLTEQEISFLESMDGNSDSQLILRYMENMAINTSELDNQEIDRNLNDDYAWSDLVKKAKSLLEKNPSPGSVQKIPSGSDSDGNSSASSSSFVLASKPKRNSLPVRNRSDLSGSHGPLDSLRSSSHSLSTFSLSSSSQGSDVNSYNQSMSLKNLRKQVLAKFAELKRNYDPSKIRGVPKFRALNILAKEPSFEVFMNPGFMKKSRSEAEKISEDYKDLQTQCKDVLNYLKQHEKDLNQLSTVIDSQKYTRPGDTNEQQKLSRMVQDRLDVITDLQEKYKTAESQLVNINKNIRKAKRADSKKAVIEINSSKSSKITVVFGDHSKSLDVPVRNAPPVTAAMGGSEKDKPETLDLTTTKLDEHNTRLFTVSYQSSSQQDTIDGEFKEVFWTNKPSELDANKPSDQPFVQLSIEKFPEGNSPNHSAKVNFAMLMARQLLASSDEIPSKKNPIVLRGRDAEQLEYLWTALMLIGKNTPEMRFGADAIVVKSHAFKPKEQLNWKKNFSTNSRYNQSFQFCETIYKENLNDFKTFAKAKFGYDEMKKDLHKEVRKFKDKQKEVLDSSSPDSVFTNR